jgi:hypothetical protein
LEVDWEFESSFSLHKFGGALINFHVLQERLEGNRFSGYEMGSTSIGYGQWGLVC